MLLKERDLRQKQIGCLGLAALIHVGLIVFIATRPSSALTEALEGLGGAGGAGAAGTIFMDLGSSSDPTPSAATTNMAQSESESVPAPPEPVPAPPPPQPVSPPPIENKTAEAPVVAAVKAAPQPAKEARPQKLPEKKKPAEALTRADSDVSVKAALDKSRDEEIPELASDISEPTSASVDSADEDALVPESLFRDEVAEDSQNMDTLMAEAEAAAESESDLADLIREAEEQELQKAAATRVDVAPAPRPQPYEAPPSADRLAPPSDSSARGQIAEGRGSPTRGAGGMVDQDGMNVDGIPTGVRDSMDLREAPGNRIPTYPREDRRNNKQGAVTFLAYVKPDGMVKNVRIERSTGSTAMNQEASASMSKWRFMPGQQGWVRKTFNFSLSGSAREDFTPLRR